MRVVPLKKINPPPQSRCDTYFIHPLFMKSLSRKFFEKEWQEHKHLAYTAFDPFYNK